MFALTQFENTSLHVRKTWWLGCEAEGHTHAQSGSREINAGAQFTSSFFIQIWTATHSTVPQKVPQVPRPITQSNCTRFLDLLSLSLTPSSGVYYQIKCLCIRPCLRHLALGEPKLRHGKSIEFEAKGNEGIFKRGKPRVWSF